jgi:hypothetical protein
MFAVFDAPLDSSGAERAEQDAPAALRADALVAITR